MRRSAIAACWCIVSLLLAPMAMGDPSPEPGKPSLSKWWSDGVENALNRAGTNRAELVSALEHTPTDRRPGIEFIVENMPQPDLETLSSQFLSENLSLAYDALSEAPWAKTIPDAIFLNDVLPYA